jgi:hypothetical protein
MRIGDEGHQVQALQKMLNQGGYRPALATDGHFGPMTRAAVAWYQARRHDPDGEAGPATMLLLAHDAELAPPAVTPIQGAPGLAAIRQGFALKEEQVVEVPLGSNRGPMIDQIEKRWGLSGQPWCAMFVAECCLRAGLTQLPPHAAQPGVAGWIAWAQATGRIRLADASYIPEKGDLFCTGTTHIGFVAGYIPETKQIETLEGNSSDRLRSGTRWAFRGGVTRYVRL